MRGHIYIVEENGHYETRHCTQVWKLRGYTTVGKLIVVERLYIEVYLVFMSESRGILVLCIMGIAIVVFSPYIRKFIFSFMPN